MQDFIKINVAAIILIVNINDDECLVIGMFCNVNWAARRWWELYRNIVILGPKAAPC